MELLFFSGMLLASLAVTFAGIEPRSGIFTPYYRGAPLDPGSDENASKRGFPWKPRSDLPSPLQSGIDIIQSQLKKDSYSPLTIYYPDCKGNREIEVLIRNSGHGITLTVPSPSDKIILAGGILPNKYIFENLHMHWGKTDTFGSEHFRDGESFALEVHIVFYNSKYGDINEALRNPNDGVVVLTAWAALSKADNPNIERIIKYVPQVQEAGSSITVGDSGAYLWPLSSLENNKNNYYAYPGSLTTPPFTEAVTFIILPNPITISAKQLSVLRTLRDEKNMPVKSNRREIQPLNGRPVFWITSEIKPAAQQCPSQGNNV